jgi:DNA helicase-2/ATP-dependent DNA helicase PcrA
MDGPGAEYQKRLLAAKLLDFDDLFLYACRLLDEKPEVLSHYQQRFRYILVDEFQDTSFAQYQLLRCLSSGNVCVIGDPDQAIYSFTGDSFKPFEEFRKDYTEYRILPLSENYRSQAGILEAAKQVIGKNQAQLPRELYARLERGLPIEIMAHASESQEAEMIARKIEGLLGGASYFTIDSSWAEKEKESYRYGLGDIAILYRFHAQARKIGEALRRAGLPCRVFGKKPEQGDAVSTAQELEDFQNHEEAAPSAILRGEWVSLMTLHRSKGLEFPVVFLAGCEEGVLDGDLEEERRLFYVGMTRAKNRLFLSYAKKRFLFGKTLHQGPSRFLRDIEEELRMFRENSPAKKPVRIQQLTLFG